MDTKERWLAVVGFEGSYEVSNLGRLRSLINNQHNPRKSPKILNCCICNAGYILARLYDHGLQRVTHLSSLVLESFVGPRPPGMDCSHLDGDHTNNRVSNLCWESKLANEHRKVGHGTLTQGENHPWHKYSDSVVLEIIRMRRAGARLRVIGELLGLDEATISQYSNGVRRKYLEGQS